MQVTKKLPYVSRDVDQQRLLDLISVSPRTQNIVFKYAELESQGITKHNWDVVDQPDYNNWQNAIARQYIDKMKNKDMVIAIELIRLAESCGMHTFRDFDLDFVQYCEYQTKTKTYNKTSKAIHADKWRLVMLLLDVK